MARIYLPYFVGTDKPIPNLFQEIIPYMSDNGFNITTFCTKKNINLGKNTDKIYVSDPFSLHRRIKWLLSSCRNYDLIHTGGRTSPHYYASKLTKIRNPERKHVHTFRVDVDPNSEFNTELRQKIAEGADRTTAVSKHTAETARKYFDVNPSIIYNGVRTDIFHPDNNDTGIEILNSEVPVFLFVGRLSDRKRPFDILRLAEMVSEANFLLVGDGPLYNDLKLNAQDLDNVFMTGRLPKSALPAIYANSTAFLFPSLQEGCPNVVLEAMASGIPIIGYQATSMPELIIEGKTGHLAPAKDVVNLAELSRKIIYNDSSRDMEEKARLYVKKNHSFDLIAEKYYNVYSGILHKN